MCLRESGLIDKIVIFAYEKIRLTFVFLSLLFFNFSHVLSLATRTMDELMHKILVVLSINMSMNFLQLVKMDVLTYMIETFYLHY
jgi:hypothetical protein